MAKKIESLTPEQLGRCDAQVEKWVAIGHSCEPCNFNESRKAAAAAYAVDKQNPPQVYITAQSPHSAAIMADMMASIEPIVDSYSTKKVKDAGVRQDLTTARVTALAAGRTDKLALLSARTFVINMLFDLFEGKYRGARFFVEPESDWYKGFAAVAAEIHANKNVVKSSREALEKMGVFKNYEVLNTRLSEQSYGSHDADWLSFFDYFDIEFSEQFKEEGGLCPEARPLIALAKNCGWWASYEDVVIFQDRHCVLKLDDNGLVHSPKGPAIAYPDGAVDIYVWKGQEVPKHWIEGGLTATEALGVENTELRRAACEILGWEKVLSDLDSKTIQADEDPEIGTLISVNLPDAPNELFLKVLCGTGRTFIIPVPSGMKTAKQANAWLWGLKEDELLVESRT